jgi:hypothetical protein
MAQPANASGRSDGAGGYSFPSVPSGFPVVTWELYIRLSRRPFGGRGTDSFYTIASIEL